METATVAPFNNKGLVVPLQRAGHGQILLLILWTCKHESACLKKLRNMKKKWAYAFLLFLGLVYSYVTFHLFVVMDTVRTKVERAAEERGLQPEKVTSGSGTIH